MALTDGPIKDAWEGLSPGTRHAISLVVVGAMLAVMFFVFIRDPLSAATETNGIQDKAITKNTTRLDQAEKTIAEIASTQAVQTNTIANMQDTQRDTKTALDAINRKLDHIMERGR